MIAATAAIGAILNDAQQRLIHHLELDARTAKLEARLLLQALTGHDYAWLIAHETDTLESAIHRQFLVNLQQRLSGHPIAHILQYREFFGLRLRVTPDTLIPRPDTETLVEAALERVPLNSPCRVLDLGTGTGAIALAIAAHRPDAEVLAIDASALALTVAMQNAKSLAISNVRFKHSDWFSALASERFDCIVSNPPYIADRDPHLLQGDLRFEPRSALVSGIDGLDAIRKIVMKAPGHMYDQAHLLIEHGYDQGSAVAALFAQHQLKQIGHAHDIAGITRVTYGQCIAIS